MKDLCEKKCAVLSAIIFNTFKAVYWVEYLILILPIIERALIHLYTIHIICKTQLIKTLKKLQK